MNVMDASELYDPELRELPKSKKYPIYRVDTIFSKTKYTKVKIIENGGWHFSNIKSPRDIEKKFSNAGYHNKLAT